MFSAVITESINRSTLIPGSLLLGSIKWHLIAHSLDLWTIISPNSTVAGSKAVVLPSSVFQYNCHNLTSLPSFSEASYFMTVLLHKVQLVFIYYSELLLSWPSGWTRPSFAVFLMKNQSINTDFCGLHRVKHLVKQVTCLVSRIHRGQARLTSARGEQVF